MLAPDGGASEGFMGAALGVAQMQQNYVNLKGAVDSGQVMIKPDAAANAAKACRDQRDEFRKLRSRAQTLGQDATSIQMGQCEEGSNMRQVFVAKAKDDPNSAYNLLGQAITIMDNMANTYDAAGKMYHDTDQANAQALKGKM